jgi:hypothetical protein
MPQPDRGLWPHLPSSSRPERGASRPQLAEVLYPSLAPQPQPHDWTEWYWQMVGLHKIDARLQRERRG